MASALDGDANSLPRVVGGNRSRYEYMAMLEAVSPTGLFGVAGAVRATQVLEAMMGILQGRHSIS